MTAGHVAAAVPLSPGPVPGQGPGLSAGAYRPKPDPKIVALVIGESRYAPRIPGQRGWQPLPNAEADATLIRQKLIALGVPEMNVVPVYSGSKSAIGQALEEVETRAKDADSVIVFYSGHGQRFDDTDYIIPTDSEADLSSQVRLTNNAIALTDLLRPFGDKTNKFVFIDACRDDAAMAGQNGRLATWAAQASTAIPENTFIQFSTRDGTRADAGEERYGAYAQALANAFSPYRDIDDVADAVKAADGARPVRVAATMRGAQSLFPKVWLENGAAAGGGNEESNWEFVSHSNSVEVYRYYISMYPAGKHLAEAQTHIDALARAPENIYHSYATTVAHLIAARSDDDPIRLGLAQAALDKVSQVQWNTIDQQLIVKGLLSYAPPNDFMTMARNGDARADGILGIMYNYGVGVPENVVEARKWYERGYAAGDVRSAVGLGVIYAFGFGVKPDGDKARQYLWTAVDKGDVTAMSWLSQVYSSGVGELPDYAKARDLARRAAAEGNARGQYQLGFLYSQGMGGPRNEAISLKYYRMAAIQGNQLAQFSLGEAYRSGSGVRKDYREAFKWYGLAADQGEMLAISRLGQMYLVGQGVKRDYVQARLLLEKASDYPDLGAEIALADIYYHGWGIAPDLAAARELYERAAMLGSNAAAEKAAAMYEKGEGGPMDAKKAAGLRYIDEKAFQ